MVVFPWVANDTASREVLYSVILLKLHSEVLLQTLK